MFTRRRKNIGEAKVGLTKHHSRVPPFFEKIRLKIGPKLFCPFKRGSSGKCVLALRVFALRGVFRKVAL